MDWHPVRFHPIYKERVWGGRSLASLYGRSLPQAGPIGESWEISDRPGDVSVVAHGPLSGRTLQELLSDDPRGLLGAAKDRGGRFPLLIKILDARQRLSLQVHPPADRASLLGGEPKTEMWYITEACPDAEILAGLRPGSSREDFARRIGDGSVESSFHRIPVRAGDSMFLPSGRVHALGAGLVLFEVQENSDTTYRVFDWNRVGLDGKPRELHIPQSLESIDFRDIAPSLTGTPWRVGTGGSVRLLADHPLFRVEARRTTAGVVIPQSLDRCAILGVAHGCLRLAGDPAREPLHPGDFALLPAALRRIDIQSETDSEWILAEPGPLPPHE